MDQDSFRQLLQAPRTGGPAALGGGPRARIAVPTKKAPKATVEASQPGFKPRTVKKNQDSKYRDRASERRAGDGNDYAQVEAVLEEFEKRNAGEEDKAKVEAQRKYLGGDSQHSVLVKGLDFALLEQNKAKSLITDDDVDALDQVFLESASHSKPSTASKKKRTREELIAELKAKREGGSGGGTEGASGSADDARKLEEAKQKGKFKPIGFKPIGGSTEVTKKKKKKAEGAGGDGEKKLKKKKVQKVDGAATSKETEAPSASTSAMPPPAVPAKKVEEEEQPNDDFDIFADVGEYEGLADDGDEDDEDADAPSTSRQAGSAETRPLPRIFDDERETFQTRKSPEPHPASSSRPSRPTGPARSPSPPPYRHDRPPPSLSDEDSDSDASNMDEGASGRPMRLVPLSGSAIPSIKELLAMDKAAESQAKNRKRKLKKQKEKGGDDDDDDDEDGNESDSKAKGKSQEEKIDRDYKRLKTYTEKKSAAEGK